MYVCWVWDLWEGTDSEARFVYSIHPSIQDSQVPCRQTGAVNEEGRENGGWMIRDDKG